MPIADYEPYETTPAPQAVPAAPPTPGRGYDVVGGRPQIEVHPRPKPKLATDDYEPFETGEKATPTTPPYREIGPGEAAVHGYVDIAGYGLTPAIAGAAAAGRAPGGTGTGAAMAGVPSEAPGMEDVGEGLSRLWNDHFGNHPDPAAREAYRQGSQSVINDRDMAYDQNKLAYIAGQLGGALSMPGTIGRAAFTAFFGKLAPRLVEGAAGRLGGAALTGGLTTAAQSTGQALSEGRPEDIPLEAGKGFATGAALGGVGGVAMEALGKTAGKVASIVRGKRDTDLEAGRRIVETFGPPADWRSPFSQAEAIEAAHAGTPIGLIDVGTARTRALARSAADTSPEARQALHALVGAGEETGRFQNQSPRIANAIRRMFGGGNAATDMETLEKAARLVNKPRYQRAYEAGDRPIWYNPNPRPGIAPNELEKLASTKAVQKAIGGAAERGKDRAIADDVGMGAFNPSISVDSQGGITFNKGPTGVPTYPNMQFWDYVTRELKDQIGDLKRAGANDQADVVTTLRKRLLAELDHQVPEFGRARESAANFFGAEDALEAGQKFVMTGEDIPGAVRALARMSKPERELFARGFASDLADKIERVGYDRNVLNSIFLNNMRAAQKIRLALGPARADQLEALLRSEALIDKGRKAFLGSQTARHLSEAGMAGGAVAAYETLKGEDLNPKAILAGALGFHGLKKGLGKIDQKVAQRVGEMLASGDVTQVERALKTISHSQPLMDALRRATGAGVRVAAPDLGFANVAGAATVAGEDIADIFRKPHKEEHHEERENTQYQDQTQ